MGFGRDKPSKLGSTGGQGGVASCLWGALEQSPPLKIAWLSKACRLPLNLSKFVGFLFLFFFNFVLIYSSRTIDRNYNPMQACNTAALLVIIMLYFK